MSAGGLKTGLSQAQPAIITMNNPDFYLASTEGYDLYQPRSCKRIRPIASDSRTYMLLIEIDPPLIGQKYGLGGRDISLVIIAPRHKGGSLFPIADWPTYVHVARPLIENVESRDTVGDNELELIAWAEIYRTEEDARMKFV
jgi:hypothetical protein